MIFFEILGLVVLIMLSAFFSSAETAFFTLSQLRLKYLVKKKIPGAKIIEKLKKNPQKLLTTILIGNNLVNVFASVLATSAAYKISLNYAVGITTGVMTFLILIFGEIMPKSFATKNNERLSLRFSGIISFVQVILYPFVVFFEFLVNITSSKKGNVSPLVTEDEIKTFISIGEEAGEIKESERRMIHRIFRFSDLYVKTVMTPRNKVVSVKINTPLNRVKKIFENTPFTRLPVYSESLDSIIGFIHIKDLIDPKIKKKNKRLTPSLLRPILFVPWNKNLDAMLKMFQRKKGHMAIVVNEFGTNIGLITIEDILEEIVGEIIDETEKIEPMIKKISSKSFLVQGKTDIYEVNERCNAKLPEDDASFTVSSFILKKTGIIPKEGDVINLPGCRIKIKTIERNTIGSVVLTLKPKQKQRVLRKKALKRTSIFRRLRAKPKNLKKGKKFKA